MFELWFTPRSNYTIQPHKWTYRLSLAHIESWRDLAWVVQTAQVRGGYAQEYSGIEHAKQVGQMRFWRWQWPSTGKKRGKLRQWHFPEADYLATLAALLRVKGREPEAELVAQLLQTPLPEVTLLPLPDPYEISNYSYNQEFTDEIRQSMRLILDQRDFALANQRAERREGFTVADGSHLSYPESGKILLTLHCGRSVEVAEELYRDVLERVQKEVAT
ncbi:hypothetical protein [Armatimonas sp.]|uniref:hypothetical protein n=1 Tax=Armatimonas sp. TaxID=1872638 RepID=UPI00286CC469|nr:hypothetical protein [Armatimonas sp.]